MVNVVGFTFDEMPNCCISSHEQDAATGKLASTLTLARLGALQEPGPLGSSAPCENSSYMHTSGNEIVPTLSRLTTKVLTWIGFRRKESGYPAGR